MAESLVIAIVATLNGVATLMLVRSDFETPRQKLIQLMLIWLLPCIGSIMVIAVLRGAPADRPADFAPNSAEAWLPGSGPTPEVFGAHPAGHGDAGGEVGQLSDGGGP